jgi:hypothetical protein
MIKRSNNKLTIIAGLAALWASLPVLAQDYTHFPGAALDNKTLEAQRLVEELYSSEEYKRSLIIYRDDLAPIGDKYAQYMVGYMYLNGQGVPASRSVALAWYRLVAERRDRAIVQARDQLYQSMNTNEIVESNKVFVDLWRELGDNQLLLDLIREDLEILNERTGSRVGRSSSPVTIVSTKTGMSGNEGYYDRVRARMETRLVYLKTNVEIIDLDLDEDMAVAKSLETEVRKEMAALDMR